MWVPGREHSMMFSLHTLVASTMSSAMYTCVAYSPLLTSNEARCCTCLAANQALGPLLHDLHGHERRGQGCEARAKGAHVAVGPNIVTAILTIYIAVNGKHVV